MPRRRLQIAPKLNYEEINQRYIQCQEAGEKTRWLVIRLMSHPREPLPIEQVAEITGYSLDGVRKIIRRYNSEGPEGLLDRRHLHLGGKPPALSPDQQQQLRQRLEAPPEDGGIWSGPKVGEFVERNFGIRIHPSTAWDYLKRLGFS